MAKVLKWAQKYINLEEELEVERLRKIASSEWRMSDDSREHDETNKTSQCRDQSRQSNTQNDLKDSSDPFK